MGVDPAKRMDPLWVTGAVAERIRLEGGPRGTVQGRLITLTVGESPLPEGGPVLMHVGIEDDHWPAFRAAIAGVDG